MANKYTVDDVISLSFRFIYEFGDDEFSKILKSSKDLNGIESITFVINVLKNAYKGEDANGEWVGYKPAYTFVANLLKLYAFDAKGDGCVYSIICNLLYKEAKRMILEFGLADLKVFLGKI